MFFQEPIQSFEDLRFMINNLIAILETFEELHHSLKINFSIGKPTSDHPSSSQKSKVLFLRQFLKRI